MPTADELVTSALAEQEQGRLDLAAEKFAEALELDHWHLPASLGLARISISLSMIEQATVLLDRTLGFAPDHPEALVLRGLIEEGRGHLNPALEYFQKASRQVQNAQKPAAQPVPKLDRASKKSDATQKPAGTSEPATTPEPALRYSAASAYQARYHLGRALAAARRYKEAIPELTAASQLQPQAVEPHYALGIVHKESGKPGEAILAFTRTLELDPTFLDGYMTLADVLSEADRQDAAEKVLQQAQSLFPDVAAVYDKLAAVYLKQGQLPKVVSTLQEQVRIDPVNESAYVNLAVFALSANDTAAAATAVDQLLKNDPRSWRGLHLRSMLYDMADRLDLALADLRQAAQIAPQEWKPKNDLGALLNAKAQSQPAAATEAVQALESASALAPAGELAPRYNLALAYWNAGRKSDAHSTAQKLVQTGPAGHPVVQQAREVLAAMESAGTGGKTPPTPPKPVASGGPPKATGLPPRKP